LQGTIIKLEQYITDELGATAVEYAIIVSLIAAVIAVSVGILGFKVEKIFINAVTMFPGN